MKLKAKTPGSAAKELKRYLIRKLAKNDQERIKHYEREIRVLSPEESQVYSGCDCWSLMFEGGPFEWPISLSAGADMFSWEQGRYGETGDFPEGLGNEHVFCEAQNHYQMNFYKA